MKNSLSPVVVNRNYLRWCACSPEGMELQHIWKREPWYEKRGGWQSNINPGDRVLHSGIDNWNSHSPQISVIAGKILCIGGKGVLRYIEYDLRNNIGGHDPRKKHKELQDLYWIWVPYFEQLVTLGFDVERATRLVSGQEEKLR